mgnify:CR=1 FL=1
MYVFSWVISFLSSTLVQGVLSIEAQKVFQSSNIGYWSFILRLFHHMKALILHAFRVKWQKFFILVLDRDVVHTWSLFHPWLTLWEEWMIHRDVSVIWDVSLLRWRVIYHSLTTLITLIASLSDPVLKLHDFLGTLTRAWELIWLFVWPTGP